MRVRSRACRPPILAHSKYSSVFRKYVREVDVPQAVASDDDKHVSVSELGRPCLRRRRGSWMGVFSLLYYFREKFEILKASDIDGSLESELLLPDSKTLNGKDDGMRHFTTLPTARTLLTSFSS